MVRYGLMGKRIAKTYAYEPFRALLNEVERVELDRLLVELEMSGRLEYPFAEKVDDNLFEIRIRKGGNGREFYCYDDGEFVWLLNGFEKKTRKTPPREIRLARKIMREYGL